MTKLFKTFDFSIDNSTKKGNLAKCELAEMRAQFNVL